MRLRICHLLPASLLTFLAVALPCVDVSAQFSSEKGKKIAVLVGVNQYSKPGFEALKYAEKDMTDLKAELEKGGFKVILLLGSGAGDQEATSDNIRRLLLDKTGVLREISQDDTVLIAFSGHGEQIIVKKDGKEVETPFFCPRHAVSGDPDTLISINDVLDALDQRGGGHNLVLVDACRKYAERVDGRKSRSGASVDRSKVQALRSGIGVMFACGDRQEALEHEKAGGGHGLFFCSVLEAMRKCQPNKRGQVTWGQLVPMVQERVQELAEEVDKGTPANRRQKPQYIGNFSDDPVLLANVPYNRIGDSKLGEGRDNDAILKNREIISMPAKNQNNNLNNVKKAVFDFEKARKENTVFKLKVPITVGAMYEEPEGAIKSLSYFQKDDPVIILDFNNISNRLLIVGAVKRSMRGWIDLDRFRNYIPD